MTAPPNEQSKPAKSPKNQTNQKFNTLMSVGGDLARSLSAQQPNTELVSCAGQTDGQPDKSVIGIIIANYTKRFLN
ncbi:unnamed protein product [Ceratitis capitata]|uniref:(Mediterranean fruit fly) hypothetical protein n=1 Tax=Ceratitis capitata TaxID=7213 RepID=A0A811U1U6_CERCA|nr:unnamed protein product [Ceratitis capitata]